MRCARQNMAGLLGRPKNLTGTRWFLFAAMQNLRAWWDGGNGRYQPTIDTIVKQADEQITIPKD